MDCRLDGGDLCRFTCASARLIGLKVFKSGDPLPYEYRGPHDGQGIAHFLAAERERLGDGAAATTERQGAAAVPNSQEQQESPEAGAASRASADLSSNAV